MEIQIAGEETSKFEDDYRLVDIVGDEIHLYIVDEIREPINFIPLYKAVIRAKPTDTVYIHINSNGGDVNTTISLIRALQQCKGHTVALCDIAASAATMLTLACKEVVVTNITEFMVHTVTTGSYGTTKDNKSLIKHQDAYFKDMMYTMYSGFLSEKEIDSMIENADTLWLYGDSLVERLTKWAEVNNKKLRRVNA